jgi:type III restriction enzyme
VHAYVKNHNLGLEVPYRKDGQTHSYRPDFIVLVDDGHGDEDLLNLVVEIKGYRGEDAKIKKETMLTRWVPGVNRLGTHGRWAFAEFVDVWQMQDDFRERVEEAFARVIELSSGREFTAWTQAANRAEVLLGPVAKASPWVHAVAQRLWSLAAQREDGAIDLADVDQIARALKRDDLDVFSVLSMLTGNQFGQFNMRLQRIADGAPISMKQFVERLRAWQQEGTTGDSDWRAWASAINVSWRPNSRAGEQR